MAALKPWYQVVTPREDLRENRPLDASEFAVHLDHIRDGRAHVDYLKPERFFDRTYLTGSLLDLSAEVVRRLSGIQVETSAVFSMATQFGGGKTHSLTTLFHLAKGGEKAKDWKGVDRILQKAGVSKIPTAAVACFVGTEFDVLKGRGGEGEPVRKTPWGEIAWQLGGEQAFAAVREHDQRAISPAGDVIRRMLPDGPVLILVDELLNYMSRGRKLGLADQLYNFLQNLAEEIRGRNGAVLCVSIPSSEDIEMNPDDRRDYEALKQMLNRVGKAVLMSVDQEISEIIRRRLFEWGGMPDDGRKTASAYAEWAIEHAQELSGIDPDTVHEQFLAAYPFHPTVLSVFQRKWASLPRFQRTRGVLRMLALWIAHAYQEEHRKAAREPLITLGLAPFENQYFRQALFQQLGSDELEIPVTTDIVGRADAHAVRLDKEAAEAIRKAQLHRKIATTIFFESNGGMSQSKAEASLPEIRTGVSGPDLNPADVDNVLEGLASTCFYLNWERNRYRFGLVPNLNQILVTRRGAVEDKRIEERIKKDTEALFQPGGKELDRRFWPTRSNDVPNRAVLTMVILGQDTPAEARTTLQMMESIVRDCGSSGRTYKSALIFAPPDTTANLREATRNALAWEDIDDDEETKKRIDQSQLKLLQRNLEGARRQLKEDLFRAYRHLYLLDKNNALRHIDLGQITSSATTPSDGIVGLYIRELRRNDEITEGVSPLKLVKYWPPALTEWSTAGVRDAFYSSPQLPRLLNPDIIKRAISDGVTQGLLGYATKDSRGNLKLQKLKESLFDTDVELSEEVYILKADDAQKLLEPPRLARLVIRPEQATIKVGERAEFSVSAQDQYSQPFPTPAVEWSAKGGTVTAEGVFTAGETGGVYSVHAQAGGLEAIAEVRIVTKQDEGDDKDGGTKRPGKRLVSWRGTVPPQKWMNFYTKVLTRFAALPDLKLEVSFQVPLDPDQADAKADEARSGLKELGLGDDVNVQ
jgi:predicted AAA+ superfamily ATPase